MRVLLYALVLLTLAPFSGRAQDLHYSQFYHNPLHVSPALTGMFAGQVRAAAQYRAQWQTVPVRYRTFGVSAEYKPRFGKDKDGTDTRPRLWRVALGAQVQRDEAGDGQLSWTQAGLTAGVAHALGADQAVAAGFGVGLAQRTVSLGALRFGNQWTGEVFDPARPTKETLGQSSGFVPTFSLGLGWHYQPAGSRARFSATAGAAHLNRPAVHFRDDLPARLPPRITLAADGRLPFGARRVDAVGFALVQQMGPAREIVAGAGLRRILSEAPGRFTAAQFSLAARFGDALIPAVQLEYDAWTVGVSYDINYSPFRQATGRRGGPEIAVVYRPLPVPPLKTFKACPVF